MKKLFAIIALIALLIAGIAYAVTTLEYPKFQAIDSTGAPLSGGKVYTYEVGSTTLKTTYSDYALTTPNTNPVILDTRGEASIYLNGVYKIAIYDSDDNLIVTVDNVHGSVQMLDTTVEAGTTGFVAYYSGTSTISGVSAISGASITQGTITAGMLPDPITSGVSAQGKTITGNVYFVDLTSSETLSGNTLYGGFIGNWGAAASVTATLPSAQKGMSVLFMNTQGKAAGNSIFVVFNVADTIVGLSANFSSAASAVQLSGVTLSRFLSLHAWRDGYWFVTGTSGIAYRNRS